MNDFNQELSQQLTRMYLRAKGDKRFISRILEIKTQIIEDRELVEQDITFVNRILDDIIIINQICDVNYKAFSRYVFTNADIDCFLEKEYVGDDALKRAERILSQVKELKN